MSDKEKEIEKLTLLKDRYYIILHKMDDDTFTLTAYDTTSSYKEGELPCAAAIAQEGILEMMEIDLGAILKLGLVRIKNKDYIFSHGSKNKLPDNKVLIGSYHPSPRNVNTGRINKIKMVNLLIKVKKKLDKK